MLTNFFGKSKPINFIVIISLFFIYVLKASLVGVSVIDLSGSFVIGTVGFFLFFLIQFFFYNFIVSKNNLTHSNSYALLLFTIFIGFFTTYFLEVKMLNLFFLHLLFLRKIYSFQSSKTIFQKLFDSGFWLGIMFIIEPFSIVYFLLLYAAIYLFQKVTIRTLLIPVIGFISPLIIWFTYFLWDDNIEEFVKYFYFFTNYDLSLYTQRFFLVPLILIGFCTVTVIALKTPNVLSVKTIFRRSWVLVIFNLIIAASFIIFLPDKNGSEIIFILFPMSIIVANGLEMKAKRIVKDIVLVILVVCSFIFPHLL